MIYCKTNFQKLPSAVHDLVSGHQRVSSCISVATQTLPGPNLAKRVILWKRKNNKSSKKTPVLELGAGSYAAKIVILRPVLRKKNGENTSFSLHIDLLTFFGFAPLGTEILQCSTCLPCFGTSNLWKCATLVQMPNTNKWSSNEYTKKTFLGILQIVLNVEI